MLKMYLQMKTILIFLLIVLGTMACQQSVSSDSVALSDSFMLTKQATVLLNTGTQKIVVQLTDINESRCLGTNIVCVWEGELNLKVKLGDNQVEVIGQGGSLDNPNAIQQKNKAETIIQGTTYAVLLDKIEIKNPDKTNIANTPKENYKVWIKVIKK